MTPFRQLQALSGLSNSETADYLGVFVKTVDKYRRDKSVPHPNIIDLMEQLVTAVELVADGFNIELEYHGAQLEAEKIKWRLQRAKDRANT